MKKTAAFYGSLRKGLYNYEAFKDGLTFLKRGVIKGAKLYSLGSYPAIRLTGVDNDFVVVDVFNIDNGSTFSIINGMEMGAGYGAKMMDVYTVDGVERCLVYYMERELPLAANVYNGDWYTNQSLKYSPEENEEIKSILESNGLSSPYNNLQAMLDSYAKNYKWVIV